MDTQTPRKGQSESESSQMTVAACNMLLHERQLQRRRHLVLREAANVATKNMTQDAHLNIFHKTRSNKDKMQHAMDCEYLHTKLGGRQLIV